MKFRFPAVAWILVVLTIAFNFMELCHAASDRLHVALFIEEGSSHISNPYHAQAYRGLQKAVIDYPQIRYWTEVAYTASTDVFVAGVRSSVINNNVTLIIFSSAFYPDSYILEAATTFPHVQFIAVDRIMSSHPPNVMSLVFAEDQLGYLAGVLAAKRSKTKILGVLGGFPIDVIRRFTSAFQTGALSVCKNCTVYSQYMYSFIPGDVGKTLAQSMISDGADVIFAAGGSAGNSALLAASLSTTPTGDPVYAIGIDNDQYYDLFSSLNLTQRVRMISSAMKRLDVAVAMCAVEMLTGTYKGGKVRTFDTSNGGVSLAPCHDSCYNDTLQNELDIEMRNIYVQMADNRINSQVKFSGVTIHPMSPNRFSPFPVSGHRLPAFSSHAATIDMDGGNGPRVIVQGGVSNLTYYIDIHGGNVNRRHAPNMLITAPGVVLPVLTTHTITPISAAGVAVVFGGRDRHDTILSNDIYILEFGATFISIWSTPHGHWEDTYLGVTSAGGVKPKPTAEHVAVPTKNGILVFGGRTQYEVVNELWELTLGTRENFYNESSWTLIRPASDVVPPPMARHTALPVEADGMLIFGGVSAGLSSIDQLWLYNMTTRTWKQLASAPHKRSQHAAVWVSNSTSSDFSEPVMLVLGGVDEHSNQADVNMMYYIRSNSWSLMAQNGSLSSCSPRSRHSAHAMGNRVFMIGGLDASRTDQNTICYMDFDAATVVDKLVPLPLPIYQVSRGIQIFVYVLSGVVVTIVLIVSCVLLRHHAAFMVRAASLPVCIGILLSQLLMAIGAILYALTPDSYHAVCHARPWVTATSLVAMMACLAVKTNRIRKIFNNRKLHDHVQSNKDLFFVVSILLLFQFALLIGFSSADLSQKQLVIGEKATAGYAVYQCSSVERFDPLSHTSSSYTPFIVWLVIQFAYVGVFLLAVTAIAWTSRNVPSAYNESGRLMNCMMILCFFVFILIPLNFIVDDNPNALILIRGIGQALASLALCSVLFGPIMVAVWAGTVNQQATFRTTEQKKSYLSATGTGGPPSVSGGNDIERRPSNVRLAIDRKSVSTNQTGILLARRASSTQYGVAESPSGNNNILVDQIRTIVTNPELTNQQIVAQVQQLLASPSNVGPQSGVNVALDRTSSFSVNSSTAAAGPSSARGSIPLVLRPLPSNLPPIPVSRASIDSETIHPTFHGDASPQISPTAAPPQPVRTGSSAGTAKNQV